MSENKIARICWNTEEWRTPSGRAGKSTNKAAFEYKFGFGHEEWLFDMTKLINGWHYAFIQPFKGRRSKYIGRTFNISFYSIEGGTRQRWWVGEVTDVDVIDLGESRKVYAEYKNRGWITEMEDQLYRVGANVKKFRRTRAEQFSVIRFRPNNVHLDPKQFSTTDLLSNSRYVLLDGRLPTPTSDPFIFAPGHNERPFEAESTYERRPIDMDLAQNRWQTRIYNQLAEKFGEANVGTEIPTSGGKIDAVVRKSGRFVFYEIKTSNRSRLCIREAIGQLLEYAYFPPPAGANRARDLVIVSSSVITPEAERYLATLRERFGLPIHYQRYDPGTQTLEEMLH
jgi:hypothetical protein